MTYITSRPTEREGRRLAGIHRTEALADAAVVAEPSREKHNVLPANIPSEADPRGRFFVYEAGDPAVLGVHATPDPNARSALYLAATGLDDGAVNFLAFMASHNDGQPTSAELEVRQAVYQMRRGLRLLVGGGATNVDMTDVEKVAWCNTMRLGPADATVVTAVGEYSVQGLIHLYQLADANDLPGTPAGSVALAWAGIDPDAWTNGVPNRLNVANMVEITGSYAAYLDMHDRTWLSGV